jgi:hypothetical protein
MRFGAEPLRLIPNSEIDAAQAQRLSIEQEASAFGVAQRATDSLSARCRNEFMAAFNAKQSGGIEQRMLEDLRAVRGEYDPDDLAEIAKQGSTPVFLQLTAEKFYGALAWMTDLLAQDRPFGCAPTDIATLPGLVKQEITLQSRTELEMASAGLYTPIDLAARVRYYEQEVMRRLREHGKQAAEDTACVVDDVFTEGDWYRAVLESAEDGLALGTGIVAGPNVSMGWAMEWADEQGARDRAVRKAVRSYYAVSPMDAFPGPGSRHIDEGTFSERKRWQRGDFESVIGARGFKEDRVREILDLYPNGRRDWMSGDVMRARIENRSQEFNGNTEGFYDVVRHFTYVPARLLQEWGMPEASGMDPIAEVPIETYLLDSIVFGARVVDDPLRKRPYAVWQFRAIRGSFWGESLPRSMRSIQKICNAAARALCDNMGMASGPMMEIETDRLAANEKVTAIYPWRIWQTIKNPTGSPGPAVRPINTSMYADQLLGVMSHFMPLADRLTGIPSYSYGVPETRGAAGTSSGLAQLRADAARGLKRVMASKDAEIARTVELTIRHLRKYPDPDRPPVRGDVNTQGRGTSALVTRETEQMRMVELLAQTANPIDAQVFGPRYPMLRAELWRGALKHFDALDQDEALPSRDEMRAMVMGAMQAPPQGGQPGQQPNPREADPSGAPQGGGDARLV